MDKTALGVVGAISSLVALPTLAGAAATEPPIPPAHSYADLLDPIPNAVERLRLADAQEAAAQPRLIEAQYWRHHHHHHHHNHYRSRSWYLRHGYYWWGGSWMFGHRPYFHHHHHHDDY